MIEPVPLNPYSELPSDAYWKTGVSQENPFSLKGIYKKRFQIDKDMGIATAGSCFAQHITRELRANGFNLLDLEEAPKSIKSEEQKEFGYSLYSARYGNIYTVAQLRQLAEEAAGTRTPVDFIWSKDGRYYDALRPGVEPKGLSTEEDVIHSRRSHIAKVAELLKRLDLFIFTLGLTECWVHRESGTVYPTAPGTLAGSYDEQTHQFINSDFRSIVDDFRCFYQTVLQMRNGKDFKILLTVSPVPLTATASGKHVLLSTIYSKSVLRAVAGELYETMSNVDYFPSFEIVTNPRLHSTGYSDNLRSVRPEIVEVVMRHFFKEHTKQIEYAMPTSKSMDDLMCEEALLEEFGNQSKQEDRERADYRDAPTFYVVGTSYLAAFRRGFAKVNSQEKKALTEKIKPLFYPIAHLMKSTDFCNIITPYDIKEDYRESYSYSKSKPNGLWIVGNRLMGNQILWSLDPHHRQSVKARNLIQATSKMSYDEIVESMKQSIPIITHKQECPQYFIDSFTSKLIKAKKTIDKALDMFGPGKFFWITEPILSEQSARIRYGDEYVDSGTQNIYNSIAMDLCMDKLGRHVESKTILFHTKDHLNPTGFTKNQFSEGMGYSEINQHPNENFYLPVVNAVIKRSIESL